MEDGGEVDVFFNEKTQAERLRSWMFQGVRDSV
jgi:hypothetical protein